MKGIAVTFPGHRGISFEGRFKCFFETSQPLKLLNPAGHSCTGKVWTMQRSFIQIGAKACRYINHGFESVLHNPTRKLDRISSITSFLLAVKNVVLVPTLRMSNSQSKTFFEPEQMWQKKVSSTQKWYRNYAHKLPPHPYSQHYRLHAFQCHRYVSSEHLSME